MFLTLTLLSVAALLDFAAALRGYDRGMVEAERLFNQRMVQHLDLLDYTLPDLLARGDIEGGRLNVPSRTVAGGTRLEFQWAAPDGTLLAHSDGMPDTLQELALDIRAQGGPEYIAVSDRDDSFESLNQFVSRGAELGVLGRIDPFGYFAAVLHFLPDEVEVAVAIE